MENRVPRELEHLRVMLEYYIVRCSKLEDYLEAEQKLARDLANKVRVLEEQLKEGK